MVYYPTTPVLDSGVGANEDPLAGNWSGPVDTNNDGGTCRRVSNQFASSVAVAIGDSSWWNKTAFGPNQEAFVTIPVLPAANFVGLELRIQNPGGSTSTYYECEIIPSPYRVRFAKVISGNFSQIRQIVMPSTPQAGDRLAFTAYGNSLNCYLLTGGQWLAQGGVNDNSITTGGYLGMYFALGESTARFTEFGGGDMIVQAQTTVFPGVLGSRRV